jgi:hypothetical protein
MAAGLFALAGVAQWLDFGQAPRSIHGLDGLVIVAIGSFGLIASQSLSASQRPQRSQRSSATPFDRAIGEGLSVTWVVVGLAMASWIRLADNNIEAVEWYTLPAATALLVYGVRRLRRDSSESTWRCLGPGLALALVPSLSVAMDQPITWRGLVVGLFLIGGLLLWAGMTWESRVNDVRTAGRYVRGLH